MQLQFFGRERELKRLLVTGNNRVSAVLGVHKIGKSSLLTQLLRQSQTNQWVTSVHIELNAAINTPELFYERIYTSLGIPVPASGGAGAAGAGAGSAAVPADIHGHFQRQLAAWCKLKQQKNASHRLLLVIDECGYLMPDLAGYVLCSVAVRCCRSLVWLCLAGLCAFRAICKCSEPSTGCDSSAI